MSLGGVTLTENQVIETEVVSSGNTSRGIAISAENEIFARACIDEAHVIHQHAGGRVMALGNINIMGVNHLATKSDVTHA